DCEFIGANANKGTMSIRFCAPEFSVQNFDADAEIVSTSTGIFDDSQISYAEKRRRCEFLKQRHPSIY
ncbi:hypothetical protein Angca_000396, partial [Angiostrongylus cantonensis]